MVERRESVRVTASGEDFAREFAKLRRDAIALQAAIRAIPNQVNIRADARGFTAAAAQAKAADRSINQLSGRLTLVAQLMGALGPAAIPIGAIAVPALTGLAAQFGFAAVGAGTAVAAFQGVGTALEAMNKAHLDPTTENLQAAQVAMEEISPAAQGLVRQLREMAPALKDIRDTAATGLFPGLTEGLDSMDDLLPKVERIVAAVSGELGSIASDTGASLAGPRWDEFFEFLATDAPTALRDMATAAGNTAHAMAEMWIAFDPLNDDFSSWMVDATASLDRWASGLSKTDGFAEFIDYIRTTGPQVGETLGAIGNALVQIVQAAAPIAGPILQGIEAFADAISAIADSDLGTPIFGAVAALSALNLAMRTSAALSRVTFGGAVATGLQNQTAAFAGMRANLAGAAVAQRQLAAAQAEARKITGTYVGTLQAANLSQSKGLAQSVRGQARLNLMLADTREAHAKVADAERKAASASAARTATLRSNAAAAGKAGAAVAGLAVLTSGLGDSMGVTNTASLALMGSMALPGWGTALGAAAGAAIDLSHANDGLRQSTTAAQAAMNSGTVLDMAAAYGVLEQKIKETRTTSMFDPRDAMDRARAVLSVFDGSVSDAQKQQAGIAGAINGAAAANSLNGIIDGFADTSTAARRATGSVQGFQAALASLNGNLTQREALRQYTESLLNARAAIKANGKTLDENGDALRGHARAGLQSQRTLDAIAASAVNAAKDMAPLKGARYLEGARGDFIKLAQGMGLSRAAARRLANELLTLDGIKAEPKVQEKGATESQKRINRMNAEIARLKNKMVHMDEKGAAAARQRIAALQREIQRLDSYKTVTINYHGIRTGTKGPGGIGAVADGGTIGGAPRYPYGDKVLRYLAPGEEVISNRFGQADRHRALLKAINSGRYASGGTVAAAPRVSVSAPNVTTGDVQVTVLLDGKPIDARVDVRMADHADMDAMGRRAGV